MPKSTSAVADKKRVRRASPRAPSRGRGVARFASLLDATNELLQVQSPDMIGLYQIAERAGVPPASVYHFFPTKEAAYVALAARYCDEILHVHSEPIEARRLQSWQDLFYIDLRRAMDYFNSHPPALKILYGGYGGVEARNIDKVFVRKLASVNYDRLNQIFHMPVMSDAEKKFEVRLSILDSIWEISVRRNGYITEEYFEEAFRACNAYMRLFLPERAERRDALIEAAERGDSLLLFLSSEHAELAAPS